MIKAILTILLCIITLTACSDRAAETMVYETKKPRPEETIDYDKELKKVEDQIGFVKGNSKYYFTTPLIQEVTEGFAPLREHAVNFNGSWNPPVSRYLPGDSNDVYFHDLLPADEWDNAENGIIHIDASGQRERICLVEDCGLDDHCLHMQFNGIRGVYADGCLYFACPGTVLDGPVDVPGFILKYNISTGNMTKLMDIPEYETVQCITAKDDVLYISYSDIVSGDGFYAVDLRTDDNTAVRYSTGKREQYIGGIVGEYLILATQKGLITAYDTTSGQEYVIEEHERAELHGIAVTDEGAWIVYSTETTELTLELRTYNMETHVTRAVQIMNPVFSISPTGGIYFMGQYLDRVLYRYDPDSDTLEALADNVVAYNVYGGSAVYLRKTSNEQLTIPYTSRTRTSPGSLFWEYKTEYRYGSRDLSLGTEKTGEHISLWKSNDREVSAYTGNTQNPHLFLAGNAAYLSVYVPGDGDYQSIPMEVLRVPLYSGSNQTVSQYLDGSIS